MNNFIKQVIEEKFESKRQQRYFFAKANDKTLSPKERKKWARMAKEFSDNTNFKKLPETSEQEMEEIVDDKANFISGDKPDMSKTKGVESKFTTDDEVGMAHGQMGAFGIGGPINTSRTLRYWAEGKEFKKSDILEIAMKDSLGFEETMGKDKDYEEAEHYFQDELGLPEDEAEDRLEKMGYDEELPDGKVRLIENPKKYIEEYLDNLLLKKKSKQNDIVNKQLDLLDDETMNPIIKKQLKSLKQTITDNEIDINEIINYLKNE